MGPVAREETLMALDDADRKVIRMILLVLILLYFCVQAFLFFGKSPAEVTISPQEQQVEMRYVTIMDRDSQGHLVPLKKLIPVKNK